jgi:hypothetical protein
MMIHILCVYFESVKNAIAYAKFLYNDNINIIRKLLQNSFSILNFSINPNNEIKNFFESLNRAGLEKD